MTFQGIVNNRPRFDLGDGVAPQWLRERLQGARVEGETLKLSDGTVLRAGDTLKQ